MNESTEKSRYSAPAQLFHWLSVLLVGFAWLSGLLGDDLPKGSIRAMGLFAHVSAGQIIAALLVLRILWRFNDPPRPAEPSPRGARADVPPMLMQAALYLLLIAIPVCGVVLLFAKGQPLPLFGLAEIASPWVKDRAFAHSVKEVHEFMAHSLIVLATSHAALALVHHYVAKDRVLKRMLPAWAVGE